MNGNLENHLREACQLTAATWAAVADCEKGKWFVEVTYRLPRPKQASLEKFLSLEPVADWLGALSQGRQSGPLGLPEDAKLGPGRLYAFPLNGRSETIFVCARNLDPRCKGAWSLLAHLLEPAETEEVRDRVADVGHVERPPGFGLDQVEQRRIISRMALAQQVDAEDRLADVAARGRCLRGDLSRGRQRQQHD